jgi:hypothetical protein
MITQQQEMDQVGSNPANKQQPTIDGNSSIGHWLTMVLSEGSIQ